jgi:hypothetical protein
LFGAHNFSISRLAVGSIHVAAPFSPPYQTGDLLVVKSLLQTGLKKTLDPWSELKSFGNAEYGRYPESLIQAHRACGAVLNRTYATPTRFV